MVTLSLRAKFLLLSAMIQVLVVGLLIWNSIRLMNHAVNTNAERVAQEYAVTLNLSLGPYATRGRLSELDGYLAEMLKDPDDSLIRYLLVLDENEQPIIEVGKRDAPLPAVLKQGGGTGFKGVRTIISGATLHARAPLLLRDNRVGSINFGLTTEDLKHARDKVMLQGGVISLAGLAVGLLLFYAFTHGIGRRLQALMGQSAQMELGDYSKALAVDGDDEIAAFARALNAMSGALRERIAQLEHSELRLSEAKRDLKDLNVSLESRVRERSAALERANADLSAALQTLQRTQVELLASEKMASLGSLVAGIAHELNTPIGNSLLASTSLRDRVEDFERHVGAGALRRSELIVHLEEVRTASELISNSLHKAAELISSFKQIAVDQTNDQRREFDLQEAVRDTIATYTPRLRRAGCEVVLEIQEGLRFDSYPGGLYQVLNNLMNNALNHAFEAGAGGVITVHAEAAADGMVALTFSDNGAGMTDEVLRRVFDPFFTTRMGQGGTGLGMHIVYNTVSAVLGGRISVSSAPGAGTSVRMLLPRAAPQRDAGR
ncbi:signal transduction histidine kinase [Duganella sp. 1411]|uniref:sensor histidine kinase n=1 Tax=Duganella sp. 1411 TaxID=2806572 RepID=UPI001B5EA62D|nr:ATP-binding protein [Duganella sp. 1411]MBP1207016.1 signal transduction histidine kinase [Duganella sp. 1411]